MQFSYGTSANVLNLKSDTTHTCKIALVSQNISLPEIPKSAPFSMAQFDFVWRGICSAHHLENIRKRNQYSTCSISVIMLLTTSLKADAMENSRQ